jgi:transcriptional regulator with GAF, ATPase, and Fis domain
MARVENNNNSQQSFPEKGPGDWGINDFIGISPQAQEVREQLQWIAVEHGAKCILITGESGVGKDLAAKILQSLSVNVKDKKNFVHVNCGEFEKEHVHSELFGHRKDSYTDAHYDRLGCFRAAENGALFLNEIGNISLNIQSKLLHVLDENKVKPLGLDNKIEVNPLIIFATNADLESMVAQGLFRDDLLKRMQCYQLHIPPLRERKEDIPLLADFLYLKICIRSQSGIKPKIDKGVYGLLTRCELKGNVRELENMLRGAFIRMRRNHEVVLRPTHFCIFSHEAVPVTKAADLTGEGMTEDFLKKLDTLFEQHQQRLNVNKSNKTTCIFDLTAHYNSIAAKFYQLTLGNKARAADLIGITRKHYYKKNPDRSKL